jgi:hypothetical protein
MTLSRRDFLRNSALALGAGALSSVPAEANDAQASLRSRINSLLPRLAREVRAYSGWNPHLATFHYKLVPQEDFYRLILEEPLERMGISTTRFNNPRQRTERDLTDLITQQVVLGAYDSTRQTCILPLTKRLVPEKKWLVLADFRPEFLKELTGDPKPYDNSALGRIVGEELFHHAQLANYPQLEARQQTLIHQALGKHAYLTEPAERPGALKDIDALMTLVEGDAYLFGKHLEQRGFALPQDGGILSMIVTAGVFQLQPEWAKKAAQYTRGSRLLSHEPYYDVQNNRRNRDNVNELYANPDLAIETFR